MVVAEELVVALRSEGADETKADLDDVESSFESTSSAVEDQGQELTGFTAKFRGALTAAVAGLAVAAVGLLSQVPVIGELFDGLAAIIEAVAFQMDGVLRPVLSPISDALFDVSAAIMDAEGPMGTFIGIVATVASVLAIVAGVLLAVGATASTLVPTILAGASAFGTIGASILGVLGTILSLPVVLAVAIGAFLAFIAAYLLNWRGTRDKTDAFIGDIIDFVRGGFDKLLGFVSSILSPFADRVVGVFDDISGRVEDWASSLASDAVGYGRDIIQAIARGIRESLSVITAPLDLATDALGIDLNIGGGAGSASTRSRGGGAPTLRGMTDIFLDGRSLSRNTGRYRSDVLTRRGL